jgi:protein tyrosine phosphatase
MDQPGVSLIKFFLQAFRFIDSFLQETQVYQGQIPSPENQKGKKAVLVHCMAGCSRSVSIMTAYLMMKLNVGFDEMIAHVRAQRPVARPNKGFVKQ